MSYDTYHLTQHNTKTQHNTTTHITGQDWDTDLEEFHYYDLTADSKRTLGMTDEEFLEALKTKKSLAKVLKSSTELLVTETNGK